MGMNAEQHGLPVLLIDSAVIYAMGITEVLLSSAEKGHAYRVISCQDVAAAAALDNRCAIRLVLYRVHHDEEKEVLEKELLLLNRSLPNAKIILYSTEFASSLLATLFTKGVKGYFILADMPDKIQEMIADVVHGNLAISAKVMAENLMEQGRARSMLSGKPENINWKFSQQEQKALEMLSADVPAMALEEELQIKTGWTSFMNELFRKVSRLNLVMYL